MPVRVALVLLQVLPSILVSGADVCEEFSTHINQGFIQVKSTPHVSLTPVARTFLTDDLEASVAWFKGLFHVTDKLSNVTYDPSCVLSKSLQWAEGIEITFMQFLDSHASIYIQAAEDQWKAVQHSEYDYSRWMDNHDGFQLDGNTLREDFLLENDFIVQQGAVFSRVAIPRTSWALELNGDVMINANKQLEEVDPYRVVGIADADTICRKQLDDGSIDSQISDRFWWKSTFASADPRAAASFAETYLFGTWVDSEYPGGGTCTLSTWVQLPQNTYQLHFAHTSPCQTPSPSVDEWVEHQESIRSLESGKFDQHMGNSVAFWTESLDPFVEKLKADNVPFVVLELSAGFYGLYLSVPNNAIVLQIRSDHLTLTNPFGTFDACADVTNSALHD